MEKKLSIETIKKEIIDKLASDNKVLEYFLQDIREDDKNYDISHVYGDFIFDYDSGNNKGSYIAVEVAEYEIHNLVTSPRMKYVVSIKLGLKHKENLDKFASVIKDIVLKLFPDRYVFNNIPFYTNDYGYDGKKYEELNRLITFKIEE